MAVRKRARGVEMPFKPHKGELIEDVIVQFPDFISWLDRKDRLKKFRYVYEHIDWCIDVFDSKPLVGKKCSKKSCTKPVVRVSLASGNPDPYFWRSDCDPHMM